MYILQKNLLREARASPLFFVVQSNSALGSPPSSLLSNKPLKRSNLHQKIDPRFKSLTLFVLSPSWNWNSPTSFNSLTNTIFASSGRDTMSKDSKDSFSTPNSEYALLYSLDGKFDKTDFACSSYASINSPANSNSFSLNKRVSSASSFFCTTR